MRYCGARMVTSPDRRAAGQLLHEAASRGARQSLTIEILVPQPPTIGALPVLPDWLHPKQELVGKEFRLAGLDTRPEAACVALRRARTWEGDTAEDRRTREIAERGPRS